MFEWLNLRIGKGKPEEKKAEEKKQETMRLWEREFDIVKNGLDKEQVIGFVNNLMAQHKTAKADSSASLRSLLKIAVNDAEQMATSIKAKAQAEAEAEAARIVTQAKQETNEIKRKAEITAQKEAEDIISMANRKAQVTEVETKQQALLFLLKAREEIEKEIRQEYNRVYSRLSSSLQNLISEGQSIETELKGKTAELWESKNFELKEYEATLLGTSETAAPPRETLAPTGMEIESAIAGKKTEEVVQLQEETTEEAMEQPVQLQEEAAEEKIEQPVQLQEETSEEIMRQPAQLQEEAAVSEPLEAATEEPLEQQLAEERPGIEETDYVSVTQDGELLYSGEVELDIAVPVNLQVVSKLYDYLQTIRELRIIRTRGSWDKGTTITVTLEKPLPLISLIAKMPEVKATAELSEKDSSAKEKSSSLLRTRGKGAKRIKLALKEG